VAFYDLFRIENGLIVEHWDTIQEIKPDEESANIN
jgi:predicted SnoaL-like aldol condensation-catalyzing enzyme